MLTGPGGTQGPVTQGMGRTSLTFVFLDTVLSTIATYVYITLTHFTQAFLVHLLISSSNNLVRLWPPVLLMRNLRFRKECCPFHFTRKASTRTRLWALS